MHLDIFSVLKTSPHSKLPTHKHTVCYQNLVTISPPLLSCVAPSPFLSFSPLWPPPPNPPAHLGTTSTPPWRDALCPDYLIVFRCRSFSTQKGKNRVCPKALGYLANGWTSREGRWRTRVGGSAMGSGSGHTSQEVTPAMPDYKQCALSTSAILPVEHTTSATAKGVVLVGGRKDGVSLSLLNAASIHWVAEGVGGVAVVGARKALHWWKVATWKRMRSGLRGVEWERGGNWLVLPADMNRDVKGKKGTEMKDERTGRRKRIRFTKGNTRIGEVSVTVREECQRVMVWFMACQAWSPVPVK